MTPNDFLKILLNASNKCADPAPDGWYSRDQLGKIWGIKKTICGNRISKGIELGLVEKKFYYIPNVNGTLCPVPHYCFLDKKPNKKTCIKQNNN